MLVEKERMPGVRDLEVDAGEVVSEWVPACLLLWTFWPKRKVLVITRWSIKMVHFLKRIS